MAGDQWSPAVFVSEAFDGEAEVQPAMTGIALDEATKRESLEKAKAASVSLFANAVLFAFKLLGALYTGSVGLLSETFHSGADLVGSLLVLASVRAAAAPPDEEHPYGHAKVESVAGLAESATLGLLGAYAVAQGIGNLLHQTTLHHVKAGIAIAAGSAVISGLAGYHIKRVGERTNSAALRANGLHLLSDLLTSAGVTVALLGVQLFGVTWLDGSLGIVLGAWLFYNAIKIGNDAFQQLIDRRLPDSDVEHIRMLIREETSLVSFHRLRTRFSGNVRYIDFHVVVPNTWSVIEAHQVADRLEHKLRAELAPATVVIHVDPYDSEKALRGQSAS